MVSLSPTIDEKLGAMLQARFTLCEFHPKLASTNSRALELAAAKLPALIACEHQFAGRGRRQRTWLTPAGSALTFSVAASLAPASIPAGLSLAVAVVIVETLEAEGFQAKLKWPNDIIGPAGGKLGGILVELAADNGAVVGLGLNLLDVPQDEKMHSANAQLLGDAESLASQGKTSERDSLLAKIALALLDQLESWPSPGLAKILSRWEKFCVHRPGDMLQITTAKGDKQEFSYVGLDSAGQLQVKDENGGLHSFASAEIACESVGS